MSKPSRKSFLKASQKTISQIDDLADFQSLVSDIEDTGEVFLCDADDLGEFLHNGMAEEIADSITDAFADTEDEKAILGWSIKETMETIRLRYLPRYDDFCQATTEKEVQSFLDEINSNLKEATANIALMIQELPHQVDYLKEHPKRRFPPPPMLPKPY